jgi:hypothetical protein
MTAATEQIITADGQDLHVAVRYGQAGASLRRISAGLALPQVPVMNSQGAPAL